MQSHLKAKLFQMWKTGTTEKQSRSRYENLQRRRSRALNEDEWVRKMLRKNYAQNCPEDSLEVNMIEAMRSAAQRPQPLGKEHIARVLKVVTAALLAERAGSTDLISRPAGAPVALELLQLESSVTLQLKTLIIAATVTYLVMTLTVVWIGAKCGRQIRWKVSPTTRNVLIQAPATYDWHLKEPRFRALTRYGDEGAWTQ